MYNHLPSTIRHKPATSQSSEWSSYSALNLTVQVDDVTYKAKWTEWAVALGGLVVSVPATEPKVCGFKHGRGRWILRVIKSVVRLDSEWKWCHRSHVVDLRHVKEPYEHGKIQRPCFSLVFHLLRYYMSLVVESGWLESGWSWGW
jgi:hypothetical protein